MSAEIATLSLSHLGIDTPILNLTTDKSAEGRTCRLYYDLIRSGLLRSFRWPFATLTGNLALHAPNFHPEWGFGYVEPQKCARFLRIVNGERIETPENRIPYRIVGGPSALRIILTDEINAVGEWTEDITDPTRFTIDFKMALSYQMAAAMAPRLTKGDPTKLMDRMWQMATMHITQAEATALNENQEDNNELSSFSRARI